MNSFYAYISAMKAKVNLTIEQETLIKVKKYAEEQNISVSSMVEEYFETLIKPAEDIDTELFEMVQTLKPTIEYPEDFDLMKEYHEAKAKNYGL